MTENDIAKAIFQAELEVHKALGPGLLEGVYEECLAHELSEMNLRVERQKMAPLVYKTTRITNAYRMDLVVENKVVVELKSVEKMNELHVAQLLTYLKLSGYKLGLLMNFNVPLFKDGVKRLINGNLET